MYIFLTHHKTQYSDLKASSYPQSVTGECTVPVNDLLIGQVKHI